MSSAIQQPHEQLDAALLAGLDALAPASTTSALPDDERLSLEAVFEDQALSRHLDFAARRLIAAGRGFYSISSAGHEGDAHVAGATRPSDPALLHYRSGALFLHRARQAGRTDEALRSVLLGIVAGRDGTTGTEPRADELLATLVLVNGTQFRHWT